MLRTFAFLMWAAQRRQRETIIELAAILSDLLDAPNSPTVVLRARYALDQVRRRAVL